ncbi:hypothetical protein HT118_18665 [Escherichia coli]|nr:hypothetical protein [Escherichia coli]
MCKPAAEVVTVVSNALLISALDAIGQQIYLLEPQPTFGEMALWLNWFVATDTLRLPMTTQSPNGGRGDWAELENKQLLFFAVKSLGRFWMAYSVQKAAPQRSCSALLVLLSASVVVLNSRYGAVGQWR